jgi:acyl-CoA thioesterase-1
MRSILMFAFAVLIFGTGALTVSAEPAAPAAIANPTTYLADICALCRVDWPRNRTITVVCHGHSVPAGYFKTPEVHALEAYPQLLRAGLSAKFPHAVINVIVTAIGGEDSEQGARRFDSDVVPLRPDVLTIDYALNDRRIGLARARVAWASMIEKAQAKGIKVILLTPTPDQSARRDKPGDPLNQHTAQIRDLAATYHVGLADSAAAFDNALSAGVPLASLMAQVNHPNDRGHALVAKALLAYFL